MKRTWYLFYNFLVIPLLYVSLKVLGIFNSKVKRDWNFFYNFLVIALLYVSLKVLEIFHTKMKKGLQGRKRIFKDIISEAASIDKSKKLVWCPSSSLEEFAQANPIIEALKSIAD